MAPVLYRGAPEEVPKLDVPTRFPSSEAAFPIALLEGVQTHSTLGSGAPEDVSISKTFKRKTQIEFVTHSRRHSPCVANDRGATS